jgi:hypothetical protein
VVPNVLPVAAAPKPPPVAAAPKPAAGAVFAPPAAVEAPKAENPAHYRLAPTVIMVANRFSVACRQSSDDWPKIEYASATVTCHANGAEEGGKQALI